MGGRSIGLLLVILGVVLALIGVLAWAGALSWFGRLPGDIRIEREGLRVYFPVTSMLLSGFTTTFSRSIL